MSLPRSIVASALLVSLVVGCVGLLGACASVAGPPQGKAGPEADALARKMIASVDGAAWERTGAVKFGFRGKRAHLWDKARGFDRVTTGDVVVLLDVASKTGVATKAGVAVEGAERDALVKDAYEAFINDTFWLNPVVKAFDEGTTREALKIDGRDALLVSYASGGVTPGDRYLWLLDENGRPVAWRMWVQVLPLPGLEMSFEGWTRLPTGAWVSTLHKSAAFDVSLTDVTAGARLEDVEPSPDPFAPLIAARGR